MIFYICLFDYLNICLNIFCLFVCLCEYLMLFIGRTAPDHRSTAQGMFHAWGIIITNVYSPDT